MKNMQIMDRAIARAKQEMMDREKLPFLVRPTSHGIDAKWMVPLSDPGSILLSSSSSSSSPPPTKRVRIYKNRPRWLRELHHQMQVPKPRGREEVAISATTFPPDVSGWKMPNYTWPRWPIVKEAVVEEEEMDPSPPDSTGPALHVSLPFLPHLGGCCWEPPHLHFWKMSEN